MQSTTDRPGFRGIRTRGLSFTVIALFAVSASHNTARAVVVYYESFSESTLPTPFASTFPNTGGQWTNSGFAPNDQIVSVSLDTSGTLALTASGGKLNFFDEDRRRGLSLLNGGGVGSDNTTIYASMLFDIPQPDTAGECCFTGVEMWNGGATGNASNRAVRTGWFTNSYVISTNTGTGSVPLETGVNFVLLRFNYVSGNDTVDVFVNPSVSDILTDSYDGQLTNGNFAFDRIGIANFNDAVTLDGYADEIRVGTLLSDVANTALVPESSAFICVGLVVAVGFATRWKQLFACITSSCILKN